MLIGLIMVMWNNYIILMIRKYRSWSGLSMLNIIGMIGVFALIVLLISSFLVSPNIMSLAVIILIVLVIGIAYVNYTTLQLRKRTKEIYIRKLLGARDGQLMVQLLSESVVLSAFLVVSGMVLAELVSPWCGEFLGVAISVASMSFSVQILVVLILAVPVGLLGAIIPIHSFINYVNSNISKLSHRTF